ncbi:hypothetical protein MKX01_012475 [Papaver californicum]|nr:hypothetical protein MKX01_012475 [Papaver californicum]
MAAKWEEDLRSWNEVFCGADPEMKIHPDIEEAVGLPPFRQKIPRYFIYKGVLEPSLCMVKKNSKKGLKHAKIIKHRYGPPGYTQICSDGAYTKGVKASSAAVARSE